MKWCWNASCRTYVGAFATMALMQENLKFNTQSLDVIFHCNLPKATQTHIQCLRVSLLVMSRDTRKNMRDHKISEVPDRGGYKTFTFPSQGHENSLFFKDFYNCNNRRKHTSWVVLADRSPKSYYLVKGCLQKFWPIFGKFGISCPLLITLLE